MNVDRIVRRDLPPWCPTTEATDVEVISLHDIPVVGRFALDGQSVLFEQVGVTQTPLSIWAYVPLPSDASTAQLVSADDRDRLYAGVNGCLALAFQNRIAAMSPWTFGDGLLPAVVDWLTRMDEQLKSAVSDYVISLHGAGRELPASSQEASAMVETAARELIDA